MFIAFAVVSFTSMAIGFLARSFIASEKHLADDLEHAALVAKHAALAEEYKALSVAHRLAQSTIAKLKPLADVGRKRLAALERAEARKRAARVSAALSQAA